MSWITRKEYCELKSIKLRTFQYRKKSGLLQWRYGGSGRGGEAGKHIEVWIDEEAGKNDKSDRYRVNKGEPGANVVTPIKDGIPILNHELIEHPPEGGDPATVGQLVVGPRPESPPLLNLPAIINDRIASPKVEEIVYLRMALLKAWRDKVNENGNPKTKITIDFLTLYNSGFLFPNIFEKIKEVSRATLYNWDRAERLGGMPALVPQYRGAVARPITEYEEYIFLNCLLHQNRLKVGTAIKFTKTFLAYKKIESPSSESKLRRFAEEFQKTRYPTWVKAREGAKALNDKCLPYAERDPFLLEVGEGLVADGHRLNFQVVHPFTGKPCRATIVLFWDWKSAYPLGFEIMVEENIQCIASALRNAILTLGKIPKWLLIDNGKAFKAKVFTSDIELEDGILYGMFATLGIHTHFSQAYNPQEKPLERFWGTFNNWFERLMDSYTGASIEDKPAWMKRNEKDAQARHKNKVPKIEYVQEAIYKWIDFYATQPSRGRNGKTPREIFEAEKGPGIDPAELYHLMMVKEKMPVHRNGVTFNGWHYYDEALSDIHDDVIGKYSHSDYSKIYCFYKNQLVCIARPIERIHPMISESEAPKDYEALQRMRSVKNRIKRKANDFLTLIETGKDLDLEHTFRRSPDVAEVVKAIEATQKTPKMISAFPEEVKSLTLKTQTEESKQERPWFRDEYERYRWVMHQETISQDDRDFIDDFRARSLLYKNTVFTDQKTLDQKVINFSKGVNDEGLICNGS